jgi:hypothetical protein
MTRPPVVLAVLALTAAALAACGGASSAPPPAEFVVTLGDTSLWVRTGPDVRPGGVEVRRAPLLLARVDGRFQELYVTEDDYSFPDAVFAAQTVWRRDLESGDSVVVYGDATAPRLAMAYGRRHPHELPLAPDESGTEEPSVTAVTEAFVVDVLGSLATVETFMDLHPERGEPTHVARRRVVDLRRGTELTLADLLGDSVSARVVAHGRAAFAQARDSARSRAPRRGDAATRTAAALDRLAFDERSFALAPVRRDPGIVFYVPGQDVEAEVYALPLPAIPVPDGEWWLEARGTLPVDDGARDARARWPRANVALEAQPAREGVRLVLRDGDGRSWPITQVTDSVRRVYWLDGPASSARARAALARAFHDASLYDGELRAAVHRPCLAPRGGRSAAVATARPVAFVPRPAKR